MPYNYKEKHVTDLAQPETRYAQSGDVNIAYQVLGDGPIDIVLVPGLTSNIEMFHELPGYTATLQRLARFARVITFDKRGQGLSDRMSGAPSLEQRMDDVRAVMDEIGSRRAAILSFSEGACMSALFAATYPDRVSHLILFGGLFPGRRSVAKRDDACANGGAAGVSRKELGQWRHSQSRASRARHRNRTRRPCWLEWNGYAARPAE